jgi:hypothetical protein
VAKVIIVGFYEMQICKLHLSKFYVLLTVHVGIIFVSNEPDAQFFFMYVYFYSLHVSGSHVPIMKRVNCISTASGVCVTLYR